MSNQPCRYCGTELTRFEKLPDGKWKRYDKNGEHRYDICKALQTNKEYRQQQANKSSYQPNHQVVQPSTSKSQISNYVGGTSTFPVDKEPEVRGVTINSLFIKTSNMEKEIKELRKQIETLASIADSIAQKTELIVAKVGYPKPEKVWTEEDNEGLNAALKPYHKDIPPERQKAYEENSKKFDETMAQIEQAGRTTDESGVLLKDGQEIKAVQRSLSPDEVNRTREDGAMQFLNKTDVMQWENISEAFLCHNCEGKFHNGYMKLGTKLCEGCKDGIEANESEDSEKDRSDVNSFVPSAEPNSQHLRTIEDVNEDL